MKEKCSRCGQEEKSTWFFGRNIYIYSCGVCGKKICNDCARGMDKDNIRYLLGLLEKKYKEEYMEMCPECYCIYQNDYSKMLNAYNNNDDVEIVSANYKGEKKVSGDKHSIKSYFNRDREESLNELKALAKYLGCNIVIDVELNKDTDWEETEGGGTHYYTIWRYLGIATHKAIK